MGTNPESAKDEAEYARPRLYIGGKGPIRVLERSSQGQFMPGSFEDPLGQLVSEIFHGISEDKKLVATAERTERIAEERLRRHGSEI